MNNTFLLLYSPKLRRQVWILVYQKWSIAHCDVSWLFEHATNTRACDIFSYRFHFDTFSTVFDHPHLNDMYPEKAQRISVDGRPKRSEMYALSNETHLCGQGQKVIRISLFQGPRCNVQISWKLMQLTRGEWGRPSVTVIWASQRFGHPHSQNPSDTGIPFYPNPNPNPHRYGNMLNVMPISLVFWEWGCPYHCNIANTASSTRLFP